MRPTLQLNFAATKRLDPRITFSRASSATYFDAFGTLKTAQANEARFDHDPATGECKGFLIEEARTNLLTYSEQFDNAVWMKLRSTITSNAAVAPDGTMTADKLVEDTTSTNSHGVLQSVSLGAVAMSLSVLVKAAERTKVRLTISDLVSSMCYADFNLVSGTVITTVLQSAWSGGLATICPLGGGWYECTLSATATQGVSKGAYVYLLSDAGSYAYTGDGVSGLYIWGAQLEAGAFPTSYIPTTSAQATRAAEIAQMTGANFSSWYRQDEGTFVVGLIPFATSYSLAGQIVSVNDNSTSNVMLIQRLSTLLGSASCTDGGVSQMSKNLGEMVTGSKSTMALAYKLNNAVASLNGLTASTDTDCIIPAVSQLNIGTRHDATRCVNGHVARITYYPYRLSNAELQALTS